jgi:CubicO group peptidase (beta-lactamase class C family)
MARLCYPREVRRFPVALVAHAVWAVSGRVFAEERIVPPRDETELEQRLEEIRAARKIPGMGVVIADRGGIRWARGMGKANVKTGAEATPDTLFRVASIAKMWVGLSTLKLESDGKLRLDATVRSLAPEVKFENPWESTDPVRVVHLIEHTTGWDDLSLREWAHDDPRPIALREAFDVAPSSRRSRWRPGTRWCYSNAGPAVAAYIVEKIAGKGYEDYVAETFFEPMGMETATFFLTPESDRRMTRLYHDDGRTEYPYFHFLMRPSGSLNASPREMGAFIRFMLDRGKVGDAQILPAASLDRMETSTSSLGARAGLRDGYGLGNSADPDDEGFVWHGHSGGLDGTRAEMHYLREAEVGYFFSINVGNERAVREIDKLLRAYLAGGLPKPEIPPVIDPGETPHAYAGFYEMVNPRFEVLHFMMRIALMARVEAKDHRLVVKSLYSNLRGEYVALSPTLYRRPKESAVSLVLLPEGPGGKMFETTRVTMKAIPGWMAWAEIAATALSLFLMASAPLFALTWIPRKLLGRMRGMRHFSARIWPLLAALSFAGIAEIHAHAGVHLGRPSPQAVTLTACTLLFALFSLVSLVTILHVPRREMHRFTYAHTLATSVMLVVVTVYLWYWGIIGIRTWV